MEAGLPRWGGSANRLPSPRHPDHVRATIGLLAAALCLTTAAARLPAQSPPANPAARAALGDLEDAFAQIADEMEPAVCTILSSRAIRGTFDNPDGTRGSIPFTRSLPRRSTGTGSGVIIDRDGWILLTTMSWAAPTRWWSDSTMATSTPARSAAIF